MERFIGVLIEHYGGRFPVWLAPVQVMIMNITDDQEPYVRNIYNTMIDEGIRAELDTRNEKLGLKIRESVVKKIPYMVIVGKNEMENDSITVRVRDGGELKDIKVADFIDRDQGRQYTQEVRLIGNKDVKKDTININEKIRAREVRLIADEGKQLGIVPTIEALRLAKEQELDLVEVSPTAVPPVCKIMDYGKFKYQIAKKAHEAKKKQAVVHIKEMKLGLKIEEHDLMFKVKHLREFLEEGNKIKVIIMFKGREVLHIDMGEKLAQKIIEAIKDVGQIEQKSRFDGRNIVMIFAPL